MNRFLLNTFAAIFFFLIPGCTTSDSTISEEPEPEWLLRMPLEKDYFYGIGSDLDLSEAKQKSIIDVGQQFSTHVKSAIMEHITDNNGKTETIVSKVDEQITDQIVHGAKFIDQYQDSSGFYWILTRAPLSCMLDITEGFLLSYSLDLKQEIKAMNLIIESVEKTVEEKIFNKIPWTPRIANGTIRVNGNADDWDSVPVYYTGLQGNALMPGTDVNYVKVAMDNRNAYVLVAGVENWNQGITIIMDWDFEPGQNFDNAQPRALESDLHGALDREVSHFKGGGIEGRYDPGVQKVFKGNIFELSIPLSKYKYPDWFNILYVEIWTGDDNSRPEDSNFVNYESTWINEGAIPRI